MTHETFNLHTLFLFFSDPAGPPNKFLKNSITLLKAWLKNSAILSNMPSSSSGCPSSPPGCQGFSVNDSEKSEKSTWWSDTIRLPWYPNSNPRLACGESFLWKSSDYITVFMVCLWTTYLLTYLVIFANWIINTLKGTLG